MCFSLLGSVWPACYKTHKVCNEVCVRPIDYLEYFVNQVILILALLIFHVGASPPSSEVVIPYTFRVSFAFIAFFRLLLIYIRVVKLKNAG